MGKKKEAERLREVALGDPTIVDSLCDAASLIIDSFSD
jgi:hypothetical protein